MPVYPYAAQFILLYHLRPLLPNSSHYLCIWNNAFHSDMACRRVVVGKRMKSLIYWKKIKIFFFSWKKGVFDQKLREKNKKKWSRCSTTKILGLNRPFLMIQENDFFFEKRQNWKIQRCAFILAMHEWKSTNHTSYMNSNECPSIWDQSGLFSSILSEMKAQQTQQKSWNNLKEIGKNYKVRHLLISWQFMPKNWKVILCSCSQIITHQFRTNHDLQAQFI